MSAAVIPLHPPVPPPPAVPSPPPASSAAVEWAERYAVIGLPPIAIRPGGKEPLANGWQTATLEDTRAHLQANPACNLGIAVPPGFVVLDVDVKGGIDGYATLAAFEIHYGALPPTLRAKTRSGGAHLWFKLPAGIDVRNAVAFAPGLDARAGGKGYVLAEPSVFDGRPYRWENWGTTIALAPEWLVGEFLAGKSPPPKTASTGEPPSIPQGQRNSVLFERASTLRREGFSASVIHAAITALNRESCVPPLHDTEVYTIAESTSKYARGPVPHEVFGGAVPLPPGAFLEKPASAEWPVVPLQVSWDDTLPLPHLVDRWLPQEEVTLLAGHGGGGKSYVALSLAVHVALGRRFGPLATRKARALFYSAEDGGKVLQTRLARICRSSGIAPSDLEGALTLLDASDADPALFRRGGTLSTLERLRALVDEHGAELVVIDNASDAFDGDEIKRAEVRAFIRTLRAVLARPGRAVLLLAHINKMTASTKSASSVEDYSGSTAWNNTVRSRLSLNPGADDFFTIEHRKANYGPKADPVQFRWVDGVPIVAHTAPLDHSARAEQHERHRQTVVEIIGTVERRGGRVPAARTGPASTFKVLSEDAAFPADIDKKALSQFLNDLQDRGLIYRKWMTTKDSKKVEVYSCTPPT